MTIEIPKRLHISLLYKYLTKLRSSYLSIPKHRNNLSVLDILKRDCSVTRTGWGMGWDCANVGLALWACQDDDTHAKNLALGTRSPNDKALPSTRQSGERENIGTRTKHPPFGFVGVRGTD